MHTLFRDVQLRVRMLEHKVYRFRLYINNLFMPQNIQVNVRRQQQNEQINVPQQRQTEQNTIRQQQVVTNNQNTRQPTQHQCIDPPSRNVQGRTAFS